MINKFSLTEQLFIGACILFPLIRIIKFVPSLSTSIYYGVFALLGLIVLMDKNVRLNWGITLFFCICFLSIIGNNIPSYFHSMERFIGMILIVLCVGPLFYNDRLGTIRMKILSYLSWTFVCVSVISFFLYLVYRPITITERGNLFGGITVHSMTMGPIAALATLYVIQYLQYEKDKIKKRRKIVLWIACFVCLLTAVLAGSRSALLALFAALLVWAWSYFNDTKKIIGYIVSALLLLALTFPVWWKYTETIQKKMEYSEQQGSLLISRARKWEARIDEFKENPILGCGFASVKMPDAVVIPQNYKGTVEPGNGWLFLLSSTGLVSFVLFASFYGKILHALYKIKTKIALLLLSSLIFLGIHMMAEGYIVSSGNFFFFYLWLCLGTATCYIYSTKEKTLL